MTTQEKGLSFEAEGIYFNCFRKPLTTSLIQTYPIPPYTTIRGMISNALGLPRDDHTLQETLKIGIKPLQNEPTQSRELAKILKLISRENPCFKRTYPSAPMHRDYLINPSYKIYLMGDPGHINEIRDKLQNPARPLYLGQSDDMTDIKNIQTHNIQQTRTNQVHTILEGIHEESQVINLPYKFHNKGKTLENKTISIPKTLPKTLKQEIECYKIGGENVCGY